MTSFLKWAGGKSQILPELRDLFPNMNKISGYIEPFIGGGSVFFDIRKNFPFIKKENCFISDINSELINTYRVVRDHPDELIKELERHQKSHNEEYYYKIREIFPPGIGNNVEKAGMFIYLNKTCFNGLWRVNSSGKNNVPIGHKNFIEIFDRNNIFECSKLLNGVRIECMSFENILKIKDLYLKDWLIFNDPPYLDVGEENFTQYSQDGFHLTKRSLLISVFKELDNRGGFVMLSQSDNDMLKRQFKDYNIHIIKAKRMINSNGKGRGYVNEIVITNYQTTKRQKTIDDMWTS